MVALAGGQAVQFLGDGEVGAFSAHHDGRVVVPRADLKPWLSRREPCIRSALGWAAYASELALRGRRYCAELVAACLQRGGLMSSDSSPGAATPHSLYKMYKQQGAVSANPCTLRQQFSLPMRPAGYELVPSLPMGPLVGPVGAQRQAERMCERNALDEQGRRSDSPPRQQFRVLQQPSRHRAHPLPSVGTVTLTLSSLGIDRTRV